MCVRVCVLQLCSVALNEVQNIKLQIRTVQPHSNVPFLQFMINLQQKP
jgi:hypothetical protein